MPQQERNEEIDLIDLFIRFINAVRANIWLIVSFSALGLVLGLVYFFFSKKVYESKMIISSSILTESYSKSLLNNTNRHILERDYSVLTDQLKISEAAASQLASIKVESLTEAQLEEGEDRAKFIITTEVFDRTILPELQVGIVQYFESNHFVKIRVEQDKARLKQMLASVEREITDMEEFKIRIFKGDFFQNAKGNIMFDPTTVNTKILELVEKKINFQNELEVVNSVQVIDGFATFQRQVKPKLSISIAVGFFAGVVMALAVMALQAIGRLVDKKAT